MDFNIADLEETTKDGESTHIRWSKELSDGEKAATRERKKIVAECLRRNSIKCDLDKVPCVALLGSGGGVRAMIALMGTLSELGSEDLLDSIMYLCGVSGSTWCMSLIYEDINWSKNVKERENKLREDLNKPSKNLLSVWQKIQHALEEGMCSLTILWSYIIGSHMIKEINENSLSKQKRACVNGVNPYPIYAAVEKRNIINENKNASGTWFEFTPHDSGFPDYGAFVNTEVVGSKFKGGDITTKGAEKTICYLRGLWGSALADEHEIKTYIKDYILGWFSGKHEEEEDDEEEEEKEKEEEDRQIQVKSLKSCAVPVKCTCECCEASEFITTLSAKQLAGEVGHKALLRLEEELLEDSQGDSPLKKETTVPVKCMRDCCEAAEFIMSLSVQELAGEVGHKAVLRLEELLEECKKNDSHHMTPSIASDEMAVREMACMSLGSSFPSKSNNVTPPMASDQMAATEVKYMSLGSFFPSISSAYEKLEIMAKLMKSLLSWQWGTTYNYLYKCNTTDNPVPKELVERKFINLIDAGLAINSAYPLVLRPEREVNAILSFDFSAGDPFETLKLTAEYCRANNIPFPHIDVDKDEEETPSGFYVFKGPNVPTVLHIPLFNTGNCADEIEKYRDTFSTFKPSYSKEDVDDLLKVSKLNVQKNKSKILEELAKAVLT
ncbi:cytosolic phospholipase A2 gamma-like isoform X2 [Pleurodeles waltl]|uniref:cytosolic phospholipase A2 gamma-like isoform X2 n=1 Tax=Pleurodeles waltl TaxID=8319 RepID=UPI003709563D